MSGTKVYIGKQVILEEVCANSMETDGTAGEETWLALGDPYDGVYDLISLRQYSG